jgi:type I restriction enzyme S subunit
VGVGEFSMNRGLPEFWAEVKLTQISFGVSTNGKKVKTQDALPTGKYEVIDQSAFGSPGFLNDDARVIQASADSPVILFGDHTRVVKYIEHDFIPGADGTKLLSAKAGIDPRYLRYLIESADIPDRGYGRHFQYLNAENFPLAPAAEQTRIANQLDTLLTRVQACNDRFDAIPALLKRFRQTVLDAATTGGLTDDWRDQGAKPWANVQLREVASTFSYGSAAKSSKAGDVPVLRMGNIQSGRLDWSDLVFTSDKKEIEKYKLTKGDVLFNRTNSPELVGKTAVFQGEREAVYAGYLIRVRCLPNLQPEYLNYCLGSKAGREYCWSVKSDGVSQSNINAKKLAAFSFLLPELAEQTEIVRRVEALFALADRIEARCTTARAQAQRLSPLVLAKAFRGELVEQDPNDEPASALLARIASAKTAAAGKKESKVPVARKKRASAAINS